MRLGMKKVWLWTKLVVILLVVAWVTLFFVFNRNNRTNIWLFFGFEPPDVSLDIIVPVTALVSILVYYVVRKITSVFQQLNQVREAEKVRQREERMEQLARQVEKKLSSAEGPKRPEA